MTDLFDPAEQTPSVAVPLPTAGRLPTKGEYPCNRCGFAACFFDGATPWCRTCAPAEFRPGRANT